MPGGGWTSGGELVTGKDVKCFCADSKEFDFKQFLSDRFKNSPQRAVDYHGSREGIKRVRSGAISFSLPEPPRQWNCETSRHYLEDNSGETPFWMHLSVMEGVAVNPVIPMSENEKRSLIQKRCPVYSLARPAPRYPAPVARPRVGSGIDADKQYAGCQGRDDVGLVTGVSPVDGDVVGHNYPVANNNAVTYQPGDLMRKGADTVHRLIWPPEVAVSLPLALPVPIQNRCLAVGKSRHCKKYFRCAQCYYLTDRKNNLKRHLATMHQDCGKTLECCDVIFRSKAALRDHVIICHRSGYRCKYCARNFCRKALLKRHLVVHTESGTNPDSHPSATDPGGRNDQKQPSSPLDSPALNRSPEARLDEPLMTSADRSAFCRPWEGSLAKRARKHGRRYMSLFVDRIRQTHEILKMAGPDSTDGDVLARCRCVKTENVCRAKPPSNSSLQPSTAANRLCVDPYKCASCFSVFANQLSLAGHMRSCGSDMELVNQWRPLKYYIE